MNPDPLQLDDEEPWPYHSGPTWLQDGYEVCASCAPEPRRSWLSRLIAAIRRRLS